MKTWRLEDFNTMNLVDNDTNTPLSEGFARVKVTNVAVCAADISVFEGKINVRHPLVPARVATGLVSEAIDSHFNKGQRVLISSEMRGSKQNAIFGLSKDGLLAEYVTVPNSALYELQFQDEYNYLDADSGIPDVEALFVEDIALCINVISKLELEKTQYIVLMGASYMNCIIAELAIYHQAVPIMIDNDADRLMKAQDIGCYYTINTQEENALQKVLEITSGKMADSLAFDSDAFTNAADICAYLKVGGRLCLYGNDIALDRLQSDLSPILKNELIVCGETSPHGSIESAINMLMNDIVKVDMFVESVESFDKADEVFKDLSSKPRYMKTIIKL